MMLLFNLTSIIFWYHRLGKPASLYTMPETNSLFATIRKVQWCNCILYILLLWSLTQLSPWFLLFSHLGNESYDTEVGSRYLWILSRKGEKGLVCPSQRLLSIIMLTTLPSALLNCIMKPSLMTERTSDPAHWLDFLAKDIGKLKCIKPFWDGLNQVISLLTQLWDFVRRQSRTTG